VRVCNVLTDKADVSAECLAVLLESCSSITHTQYKLFSTDVSRLWDNARYL